MAADGSIVIDTKIDDSKLPAQLKKISSDLSDGAKQAEKLFKASMAGIAAAIGTLTAATANYLGTTDKIDKMSQSIGLSKEAYQEWDYVLSQNGASIESLEMGMKTLVMQIDATNSAADKSSTALGQLGISATDSEGNIKSQEVVLREVISALQDMPQGTEKARLANELLGRSGTELAATLNQTAESTEALRQRAHDLGIVLGDETVNAGVVLGDTLADIKLLGGGLINSVITPLIPAIQEVADKFITWATEGDKLKEIIAGAFDAIKDAWENGLIKALAAGILTIGAVTTAIAILNAVMAANPISIIIIGIGALVAAIVLIYENWDKVSTFISETVVTIKERFIILGSKIKEAFLVAVYSIKNGFVQLGLYIAESFMKKIVKLLDLLSNIPFIGEYFATASDSVSKFVTALELAGEEAQDSADAVIQAAKDQQDATEAGSRAEIEAIRLAREARKKAAEEARNPLPTAPTASSTTPDVSGITGLFTGLIAESGEEGDKAGKQLTNSMASAIDDTSIGVSESIGAVMDNIGAAITIAIAVVKKIFAGIKTVAKFDPQAMYDSFEEIITGLTKFFAKVGSLPSLVESGKKVLGEFMRGMLKNKKTNMETFRNVLKYMIESAKEVLPFVIEFAFIMITDMATAIIEQLPLLIDTAFAIIGALATGILDALPALILAAGDILPALLYSIITGLPMFSLTVIGHLPEIITAIINAVIGMLPELTMAMIQAWIQTLFVMPVLIIAALLGVIVKVVAQLVKDIYTLCTPAGEEIWAGIGKGIADGWNKFAEDIRKAFISVIDLFKEILGIHSPSKVFAGFGAMIMEGLKNGITGANIWDGIKSTFTTIIDNIKKIFSAETWTDIGTKIKEGIGGATSAVSSAASTVGDNIKNGIGAAIGTAKSVISTASSAISSVVSNVGAGISSAASTASSVLSNVGAGISSAASKVGGWFKGLFKAEGTNNFRGGTAIINEEGAELVTLPSGSKIMTASATAQMQDRAISQLLSGMKMPSFATAGSGGNKSITIENKINAPIMVEGSVFGRLVYETIDKAVV